MYDRAQHPQSNTQQAQSKDNIFASHQWESIQRQEEDVPNSLPGITYSLALVSDHAIQAKSELIGNSQQSTQESHPNQTGLPDALKAGVENLSGYSLDDVRVHYNSPKPAQLQASAYTQGTEIHVAPGQEKHLPHEAWHVVQQMQGRVKPTMQMKGVQINNDEGLEREADVMGGEAVMKGQKSAQAQQKKEPPSAVNQVEKLAVVQRTFPDSYNNERKGLQVIDEKFIQLDHMVPQETLKKFAETYKTLEKLTKNGNWQKSKEAMDLLRKSVVKTDVKTDVKTERKFMSEEHLINIPQNIVPGLIDQAKGADNDFDPQVVKKTNLISSVTDIYEETALSISQRSMDSSINTLNKLIDESVLPANVQYNEDVDRLIAEELEKLAEAFNQLSNNKIDPTYDSDVWYSYQEKKGEKPPSNSSNNVKKRPAEWINDKSKFEVGGGKIPEQEEWYHKFSFNTHSLKKLEQKAKKPQTVSVKLISVTVNVNVNVSTETWKHLYERHFLFTFKGKIEPVNTFWKADPYKLITSEEGINLLEEELEIMLRKSFNFSKPYNNLEAINESCEEDNWSKAAKKLFFQGDATSILTEKKNDTVNYEVTVNLKSIAPQAPDLAYALLPDQLVSPESEKTESTTVSTTSKSSGGNGEKQPMSVEGEKGFDKEPVESVENPRRRDQYMVVRGDNWTRYIQFILGYFNKIESYQAVMESLKKLKNINLESEINVGSEQELQIIKAIKTVIAQEFIVQVTPTPVSYKGCPVSKLIIKLTR